MRLRPWTIVSCWLALSACARRSPDAGAQGGQTQTTGGAGQGGDGGSAGTSTTKPRDLSHASFTYDGPLDDGSVDTLGACATEAVPALPVALDMYLVLDRSASMSPDCNVGDSTRSGWCYAINALGGFFAAPTSNGLGIALQFFPSGDCTWTSATEQNCCFSGECCAGSSDATPIVPLSELPGQLPTLLSALNRQAPLGTTTPLEPALRGLTQFAAQAKRGGRQMVGVLVTDGDPNGCETNTGKLAAILSNHRAATGQLTFVIGMTGANHTALETLALAGGAAVHNTHCGAGVSSCTYYDVGDGNPEAFIDALQQIQRSVVGCRFGLPTSDAGVVDPKTLAVQWQSPDQLSPKRLPYVGAIEQCGDGWYADPAQPAEFALCPSTCTAVQGKTQVRIDVLAGCLGS